MINAPTLPSRVALRGFTLVELSVCLVLLALLTSMAALSLQGLRKNVDLRSVVDQISSLDRQTRQRAESRGESWRIVIDLDEQELWSERSGQAGWFVDETETLRLRLPSAVRLEGLTTVSHRAESSIDGLGQGAVTVSALGVSPTYRLRLMLNHPSSEPVTQSTDLLICGGSGQFHVSTYPSDETSQPDIFEALWPAGHDPG